MLIAQETVVNTGIRCFVVGFWLLPCCRCLPGNGRVRFCNSHTWYRDRAAYRAKASFPSARCSSIPPLFSIRFHSHSDIFSAHRGRTTHYAHCFSRNNTTLYTSGFMPPHVLIYLLKHTGFRRVLWVRIRNSPDQR